MDVEPGGEADPQGPAARDALADERAAVRRLIEQGAGSPEELRDLAARLRQLRDEERAQWQREVRPRLVKEARRLRGRGGATGVPPLPPQAAGPGEPIGSIAPPADRAAAPSAGGPIVGGDAAAQRRALAVAGLAVLVGLGLLAAATTVWLVLVPLVGLLVAAWVQGRAARS